MKSLLQVKVTWQIVLTQGPSLRPKPKSIWFSSSEKSHRVHLKKMARVRISRKNFSDSETKTASFAYLLHRRQAANLSHSSRASRIL